MTPKVFCPSHIDGFPLFPPVVLRAYNPRVEGMEILLKAMRRVATDTKWNCGTHERTESIVMTVGYARPDVADMVLRVYERSVHPELFDTVSETCVKVAGGVATLRLGRHGHLLEYRTKHSTLTEIATSKFAPLPSQMCVIDRRLIGYRTHTVEGLGVRYHCSYQLETAPAEIYLTLHRELETDAQTSTLAVALPGSSASSPDCLSLLKCDLLPAGLVVHAFHTFPHEGAVLRIQTLFERL